MTPEEKKVIDDASISADAEASAKLDKDIKSVKDAIAKGNDLKPNTIDAETYNKIINIVNEATKKNFDNATLIKNIKGLSSSALSLFNDIASIASKL